MVSQAMMKAVIEKRVPTKVEKNLKAIFYDDESFDSLEELQDYVAEELAHNEEYRHGKINGYLEPAQDDETYNLATGFLEYLGVSLPNSKEFWHWAETMQEFDAYIRELAQADAYSLFEGGDLSNLDIGDEVELVNGKVARVYDPNDRRLFNPNLLPNFINLILRIHGAWYPKES